MLNKVNREIPDEFLKNGKDIYLNTGLDISIKVF